MKKPIITALCLLLMLALAMGVLAASNVTISLSAPSTIGRGESVVVIVAVSEFENCKSGSLKISYDESLFTRSNSEWLISGTAMAVADGDAVFAYSSAKTISGNIYQFTLTAKADASFKASDISASLTLKTANGASSTASQKVAVTVACGHSYDNACDTTCNLCGAVRTITHSFDSGKITMEPTCTAEGVKTYTCTVCGETKTESVAKKAHTYDGGKVTTEATCTAEGVKTYTCTVCGDSYTESIDKKAHTYDGGKVTTEATCTAKGTMTYTCTACGDSYTESIDKKAHTYDGGKVTTEATCTAKGTMTYTCTACGAAYTESIAATGHSYDNVCDTDCNNCGKTRTVEHDYSSQWSFDENGHWHACRICGDCLEMVSHTPGEEATEETDQICTVCGYIIVAAHSHEHSASGDWLGDESSHWHQCACGELIDVQEHAWDGGTADMDTGLITYYCTVCGYPRTERIPQESQPEETTEPTENATQPTEGTQGDAAPQGPGTSEPNEENGFLWWIVAVIVGVLLFGALLFVIIGILVSKKQTGKYSH